MSIHIYVYGSPGSGKSVFSAALAKAAMKENKRAIIVSGDMVIPMLPFFCGYSDITGLGELCKGEITAQTVAGSVKLMKEYPDIGVMGLQFDDEPLCITIEQLQKIAKRLDELVDIVIWDGTSDIDSTFARTILPVSDVQICILTADKKGILYFENYREIIKANDKCILLEGLAKPYSPYEEMHVRTGGLKGRLYYGKEIEKVCMEGNIFSVDDVCHESYRTLSEKILEQAINGKEA